MPTPLTISRATVSELDAIAAIERGCFAEDAFTRRQLNYLISKAQGICYIAYFNKQLVGYISLLTRRNTRNVRIYSLAVAAEARKHGVGQALIAQTIVYTQQQKQREVSLEVRTDNTSALVLYLRNGFVPDKILRNYYHDGTDAQRMILRIVR